MSCSYGIVIQGYKDFVIVNARPGDHHVDVVVLVKQNVTRTSEATISIHNYYQGIESILFDDDGTPYTTSRMEFTTNHDGSLVVTSEHNQESCMKMAKLVLWCESLRASKSKALEQSVKISKFTSKEKEEGDMCAICHEEYQVDEMIGTLGCKHRYHEECIKKWIVRKDICPVCRDHVTALRIN